jgi:hypothetical protein
MPSHPLADTVSGNAVAVAVVELDDDGAFQSGMEVGADVLFPHVLLELRLTHQPRRLSGRATQDQGSTCSSALFGEVFEGLKTRGINGRQVAKSYDDYETPRRTRESVCPAKCGASLPRCTAKSPE